MKTHGMTINRKVHPFYHKWSGIKYRCSNPRHPKYAIYGGRGIKNLWPDFNSFKSDMYDSYVEHAAAHGNKDTIIDRIDPNGDYCKENCRWVTQAQSTRNRRGNTGSKSGLKGVQPEKPSRWRAQITVDGKHLYLGSFPTKEEAARAYDTAAANLHGKYAYANLTPIKK